MACKTEQQLPRDRRGSHRPENLARIAAFAPHDVLFALMYARMISALNSG